MLAEGMYGGDSAQILHYITPWEKKIQASAPYFLRRGELHEMLGMLDAAQRDFSQCLPLRDSTPNVQMAGVRPLLGLARLAMLRQDTATALECVDQALADNHRDPEALLALVSLTQQIGGAPVTGQVVEAYLASHGDCSWPRRSQPTAVSGCKRCWPRPKRPQLLKS
jgi:tetratricopeptide (TPR) repeat protein